MTQPQNTANKISSTDEQWEKWGSQNPYRGVLGLDTSSLDETSKSVFFNSGRDHIRYVLSLIEMHFGSPCPRGSALDFGCGVGRLLPSLGEYFSRVIGVDVSQSMLSVARQNTEGLQNIGLAHGLDAVDGREGFDLVHSYIVMQHIRPAQGMEILERLISHVRPDGFLAVHLTIGDLRPWRRRLNVV
ncbi:MAG: class I SAM-dependent methyltransferase, partial [Methylococcales bacterium]